VTTTTRTEPVVYPFNQAEGLEFADRADNQHIGFGHRAHHCLGAQLARAELQEALRC
jgi:cytochrome P450